MFQQRHLIVTNDDHLSDQQRADLRTMFQYLPELRTLRNFAEKVNRLFDIEQLPHQAHCCRAALLANMAYAAVPKLATAIAMLRGVKFDKMIAFLRTSPAPSRAPVPQAVRPSTPTFIICQHERDVLFCEFDARCDTTRSGGPSGRPPLK